MKAVVTGHSRGIGAAIGERLLSRDIAVLGLARTRNLALAQRFPALEQIELDLSDSARLEEWLDGDTLERFLAGSESVALINNAGMLQPIGPITMQEPRAVAQAVTVNVASALMLSSAFGAATTHARDRRIMHVSSGAGTKAYAGWSVYCATKAALDHHARAVTLDQLPGFRICSVAPGVVDTDMQAEIRATTIERFPERERFVAMKRDDQLPSPDVAAGRLVDYLLSDAFGEAPVADLRARST